MKIEKSKIVFSGVLLSILLFIGAYAALVFDGEESQVDKNQIPLPEIMDDEPQYNSKLEALDALKEARQNNAPSLYDEDYLDTLGRFDPELPMKRKAILVDSILQKNHSDNAFVKSEKINRDSLRVVSMIAPKKEMDIKEIQPRLTPEEWILEHQLFFASDPQVKGSIWKKDKAVRVSIDGDQTVRQDHRVRMRLIEQLIINGQVYPKNTVIYGFVSFRPNRTLLDISNIDNQSVQLKAYDIQDGAEGIYIQNSFRSDLRREVIGDVADDINIAGVPQISGIKRLFQRNNRQVKVTILDNYQLLLKSAQ